VGARREMGDSDSDTESGSKSEKKIKVDIAIPKITGLVKQFAIPAAMFGLEESLELLNFLKDSCKDDSLTAAILLLLVCVSIFIVVTAAASVQTKREFLGACYGFLALGYFLAITLIDGDVWKAIWESCSDQTLNVAAIVGYSLLTGTLLLHIFVQSCLDVYAFKAYGPRRDIDKKLQVATISPRTRCQECSEDCCLFSWSWVALTWCWNQGKNNNRHFWCRWLLQSPKRMLTPGPELIEHYEIKVLKPGSSSSISTSLVWRELNKNSDQGALAAGHPPTDYPGMIYEGYYKEERVPVFTV